MPQTEIDRIVAIVRTTVIGIVVALAGILTPAPARAASAFANWSVVVASAAYMTHGVGTRGYDMARRDVAAALAGAGFAHENIVQLSRQPDWFPDEHVDETTRRSIARALGRLVDKAPDGCLLYLVSRGHRDGIVVGGPDLAPAEVDAMLDDSCGDKPTIVIISACYSGVFVPALAAPNRMVFTAARADRTSFGCNESHRYPFFDGCVIASLPQASDFPDLVERTKACVQQQERALTVIVPSEPQLSIGEKIAPLLKSTEFPHG